MRGLRTRLILVLLVVLTTGALAGVVEDAEETLKGVPADGPARAQLKSSQSQPRPYPQASSSSATRSASSTGSGSSSPGSRNSGSSSGLRDGGVTATSEPTPGLESEQARRRRTQDSKDMALSFGGVLLLLLFVAVATYYGRRLSGTSD